MAVIAKVRGEGVPILILPSFGVDHHAMMAGFEPALRADTRFARHYVDLPGTVSAPPIAPTSDAVLDAVARTAVTVAGRGQLLVLGWSYGGYLAFGLARRMPQRIAGLCVVCAGRRIQPADRDRAGVRESTAAPGWLDAVPTRLHAHFADAVGVQTSAVATTISTALSRTGEMDDDYLARLRAEGLALSDEATPTPLDAPSLLLAGRRDRIAGFADLLAAAADGTHTTVVVDAEAGHYLPFERPALLAAQLGDWLARAGAEIGARGSAQASSRR